MNSQTSLVLDTKTAVCYIQADLAEPCVLPSMRELFSFGSGTWTDGADAKNVLEQASGKYLTCAVTFQTLVILEGKRLPERLLALDSVVEKAVTLRTLLLGLEDAGEVRA